MGDDGGTSDNYTLVMEFNHLSHNAVARVGLQYTFYQVTEDVGVVEVCAVLDSLNITCLITLPFNVCLSTRDITGTICMSGLCTVCSLCTLSLHYLVNYYPATSKDYGAVSSFLRFNSCQNRSCVNVSITNDMVVENSESFSITLERTDDLDSSIILNPVVGEIEITDNDSVWL